MAGFQIPIEMKINFLENVVRPSFGVVHTFEKPRELWMREYAGQASGDHLERLIITFNFIQSFQRATEELGKAKKELREAKLREERDKEREIFRQQQRAASIQDTALPAALDTFLKTSEQTLLSMNRLAEIVEPYMKLMQSLADRLDLVDIVNATSPADRGKSISNKLTANNAISEVKSLEGELSVFTSAEVAHANSLRGNNESVLVHCYTPRLQEVVHSINSKVQLFNSKEYRWLQAPSGAPECDMRPDLFVAYESLVERRDPYNDALPCDPPRQFGIFPCWNCRASIWCLFDAKWDLTISAFGESVKYLESCGTNCRLWTDHTPTLKLILFDVYEFWMIEGKSPDITKITKCRWDLPGSLTAFKNFVTTPDPWMDSVEYLLQVLNLRLKTVTINESQILGAGSYGRAFWLEDGRVLKVGVGPDAETLEGEYNRLFQLQSYPKTEDFIIPVIENTYRYYKMGDVSFSGYVLLYKGEKITSSSPRLTKNKVTSSNSTPGRFLNIVTFLHQFHNTGHTHGDPRIDNILLVNKKLKFIDMMQTRLFSIPAKVEDFTFLFNSLTGVSVNLIKPKIEAILDPMPQLTRRVTHLSTIVNPEAIGHSCPYSLAIDPILTQLHDLLTELWVVPTNQNQFFEL